MPTELPEDATGCQVAKYHEIQIQNTTVDLAQAIADESAAEWHMDGVASDDYPLAFAVSTGSSRFLFEQKAVFGKESFIIPDVAEQDAWGATVVGIFAAHGITADVNRLEQTGQPGVDDRVIVAGEGAEVAAEYTFWPTSGAGDLYVRTATDSGSWAGASISLQLYMVSRDRAECDVSGVTPSPPPPSLTPTATTP